MLTKYLSKFLTAVLYPFTQLRKDIGALMTAVADIETKIRQLNETIVAETEQQRAAIQNLRDEIANGADAASLTRIADELDASIARVKGIVPDAPAEEPEPAATT